MWHLFKSSPQKTPFDFVGVDMHSHLLPGVDDGVKTAAASLTLITALQELGFKKIYCTPHIYHDIYPNNRVGLQTTYRAFLKNPVIKPLDFPILLAAEYYLDRHFTHLLSGNELLTIGTAKYVLVETSFVGLAMNLQETLFEITMSGCTPILAHPERYHYFATKLQRFNQLVEQGVKLQLNLPSLMGYYGQLSVNICNYLLKEKLVTFVGTDMHHERHLEALQKLGQDRHLLNKLKKIELLNQMLL